MSRGLTYITKISVSSSSGFIFENIFSDQYISYLFMARFNTTVGQGIGARLRSNGVSDSTTNSYRNQYFVANGSSFSTVRVIASSWDIFSTTTGAPNSARIVISNPFTTKKTMFITTNQRADSDIYGINYAGNHTQTSSYDGIEFITASASSITGTMYVYGFEKG